MLVIIVGGIYFILQNVADEGNSANVITVTSDDGLVELTFSRYALPQGVDQNDISIKKVNPHDFFEKREDVSDELLFAYQLKPDGLELKEPATITSTIEIDVSEGKPVPIPSVFHISNDSIEIVDNIDVTIDIKNGRLAVSAKISHFSIWAQDYYGGMLFILDAKKRKFIVGEEIPITVTIEPYRPAGNRIYAGDSYGEDYISMYAYAKGKPYTVNSKGQSKIVLEGFFSPSSWTLPMETKKADQKYIATKVFTCKKSGHGRIYSGQNYIRVDYTQEVTRTSRRGGEKESIEKNTHVNIYFSNDTYQFYQCDEPPPPAKINTPEFEIKLEGEFFEGNFQLQ